MNAITVGKSHVNLLISLFQFPITKHNGYIEFDVDGVSIELYSDLNEYDLESLLQLVNSDEYNSNIYLDGNDPDWADALNNLVSYKTTLQERASSLVSNIKDKSAQVAKKAVMHVGEHRKAYVAAIDISSNVAVCVGWGKDQKKGYSYFARMRRNSIFPIAASALTIAVNKCAEFHAVETAKQNTSE